MPYGKTPTSWGTPIHCSVPKTSNIGATCSRVARYLYLRDDAAPTDRAYGVDGMPDVVVIWAECAQHRRAASHSFASVIRPRPWDYSRVVDYVTGGTVA